MHLYFVELLYLSFNIQYLSFQIFITLLQEFIFSTKSSAFSGRMPSLITLESLDYNSII